MEDEDDDAEMADYGWIKQAVKFYVGALRKIEDDMDASLHISPLLLTRSNFKSFVEAVADNLQ
jgi:hypothetical protein